LRSVLSFAVGCQSKSLAALIYGSPPLGTTSKNRG